MTITLINGDFRPLSSVKKNDWKLSQGQDQFVEKYFHVYVGETALKKAITKKQPRPSHDSLTILKLDHDIVDLLPMPAKKPTSIVDSSFSRVQGKLLDGMGPLGKLWAKLEKVARKGTQKCDVRKMLRLAEKSVLLIGQTNVLLNYNRRLNVLARFLRDPKAATNILQQNETSLKKNRIEIFGGGFYKALHKRAKGHKHGQEIRQHLGGHKYKRGASPRSRSTYRGTGTRGRKPFHQGPSTRPTERGAHASRGKGGHRGSRGRARYVSLYFSKPKAEASYSAKPTNQFGRSNHSTTPTNKCTIIKEIEQKNIHIELNSLEFFHHPEIAILGGRLTFFSDKLGKNHKGSKHIANSKRMPTGFHRNTVTKSSPACAEICIGRNPTDNC